MLLVSIYTTSKVLQFQCTAFDFQYNKETGQVISWNMQGLNGNKENPSQESWQVNDNRTLTHEPISQKLRDPGLPGGRTDLAGNRRTPGVLVGQRRVPRARDSPALSHLAGPGGRTARRTHAGLEGKNAHGAASRLAEAQPASI